MNLKSHLMMAESLIHSYRRSLNLVNRFCFKFGNILPDITCSFFRYPHIPQIMYGSVIDKIEKYSGMIEDGRYPNFIQIGIITHYLADFFTSAHNEEFGSNSRAHFYYEKILERKMKRALYDPKNLAECKNPDISGDISRLHREYLTKKQGIDRDAHYITKVCNLLIDYMEIKIENQQDVYIENITLETA